MSRLCGAVSLGKIDNVPQERAVAAFCANEEKERNGKRGTGQPLTDLQPNLIVLLYSCGADGRANPKTYNWVRH